MTSIHWLIARVPAPTEACPFDRTPNCPRIQSPASPGNGDSEKRAARATPTYTLGAHPCWAQRSGDTSWCFFVGCTKRWSFPALRHRLTYAGSARSSRSSSRDSPEKRLSDGDISIVDIKLDPIDLEADVAEFNVDESPSRHNSMSMDMVSGTASLSDSTSNLCIVLSISTIHPANPSMMSLMLTTFTTILISEKMTLDE